MSAPEHRSPLAGTLAAGRYGTPTGDPLFLREVSSSVVELSARRGRTGDLAAAIRGEFRLELPSPGRAAEPAALDPGDGRAIWIRPNAWLVVADRQAEGALARRIKAAAGDAGSVVDQSHGKTVLRLSGTAARAALRKGCRLDLDPPAFAAGSAAVTQMAQIGCVLHQRDARPAFDLIVPSSYAIPFFEWLADSAAEFGYEVR